MKVKPKAMTEFNRIMILRFGVGETNVFDSHGGHGRFRLQVLNCTVYAYNF